MVIVGVSRRTAVDTTEPLLPSEDARSVADEEDTLSIGRLENLKSLLHITCSVNLGAWRQRVVTQDHIEAIRISILDQQSCRGLIRSLCQPYLPHYVKP